MGMRRLRTRTNLHDKRVPALTLLRQGDIPGTCDTLDSFVASIVEYPNSAARDLSPVSYANPLPVTRSPSGGPSTGVAVVRRQCSRRFCAVATNPGAVRTPALTR